MVSQTMGERIRLFSTGSFVSTTGPDLRPVPKTKSLHSFEGVSVVVTAKGSKSRIGPGSITSLQPSKSKDFSSIDLSRVLNRDRAASQLGLLCRHCSTADITCPKAQQELESPSVPSLYSLAPSDVSTNDPLCRICHCCWPSDPSDPLISPCRCSGSLQYVHVSCLMHWLDISSRKLHRPPICELCLYKYRRRRVLKYREIRFPDCAERDMRFYWLFLAAVFMMMVSATATIVCFQLEKQYSSESNRTTIHSSSSPMDPHFVQIKDQTDIERKHKELENVLSTVTLISAIVFFFSFFLSMYAHVKTGISFCNYLILCWNSNLDWSIEEYKHSRDSQYLSKLEELRKKINANQKKAPDEVQPLRSSVIIIE